MKTTRTPLLFPLLLSASAVACAESPPAAAPAAAPETPAAAVAEATPPSRAAAADPASALCDREVDRLAADPKNDVAVALVLEAQTGRILGMSGKKGGVRDAKLPATFAVDPGSVMKTFTYATAIDRHAVDGTTRFDGGGPNGYLYMGEIFHDSAPHGPMSVDDALAFSSNVAAVQVYDRIGSDALGATLHALHFGEPVDFGSGIVTNAGQVPSFTHAATPLAASVAAGEHVEIAPLAIAEGFRAMTVDGLYKTGASGGASAPAIIKPESVAALRTFLEHTVTRDDGTATGARIAGYRVAGKTGTWADHDGAHLYGDFVGVVPASAPRFVILVGATTTAHGYSGGTIAAPAFARIASDLLKSANVPHDNGG